MPAATDAATDWYHTSAPARRLGLRIRHGALECPYRSSRLRQCERDAPLYLTILWRCFVGKTNPQCGRAPGTLKPSLRDGFVGSLGP